MKRIIYKAIPVFVLVAALASCKKDDTTTTTPATNNTNNTNAQGPQPTTPMPSGNNIAGALISVKMDYTTQPTGSPIPVDISSEMAIAAFYDNPGSATMVEAGTVSVNNNNLEKQANNSYLKWAYMGGTPADLNFSSSSNWNVGGSGSVTAFSYDDNASFPDYSGTVPESVTKSAGISLTLNSSTVSGADSVYVLVAAGNQSVLKSFSSKAGNITISSADLQSLPATTDNTAVLEVCPFRYTTVTKNGKNYVAIKELAQVRNININ